MAGGKDMSLPVFIPLNVVMLFISVSTFYLQGFGARTRIISLTVVRCVQLGISHTQWTIVHHFSHSCEMRAVGVRDFHVSPFNRQLTTGDNSGPEVDCGHGVCHAPCALSLKLQGKSTSSFPLLWEVH